ncbi:MAG TPA: hypothetical protein VIH87_13510 [Methylocella sp.]
MELLTKAMNDMYLNERKADGSIRVEKFNNLEDKIAATLRLLTENDKLKSTPVALNVPKLGEGRVKALANFHQNRQNAGIESDRLSSELIRLRIWLVRQGAHLTIDGKIIWARSGARVLWDTELQQRATKVQFKGGLIYTSSEKPKPLDTQFMATHFSGPGYAIYVMSKEGNLHVTSHSAGQRHHSSLLGGVPVAGAGELKVDRGSLREISNKSGHYWPGPFEMVQVLKQLFEYGLPKIGYRVVLQGGPSYLSAEEFIAKEDLPVTYGEIKDTGYDGSE